MQENGFTAKHTVEKYYNKIRAICLYNLHGDEALADDCTSDVFLLMIEKFGHLDEQTVYAWLLSTANNKLHEYYRQAKKRSMVTPIENAENEYADTEDLSEVAFRRDDETIENCKQKILSLLSENDRELYRDFFENRMSYDEIAAKMNITYHTAATRVTRLKKKLSDAVYSSADLGMLGASAYVLAVLLRLIGDRPL